MDIYRDYLPGLCAFGGIFPCNRNSFPLLPLHFILLQLSFAQRKGNFLFVFAGMQQAFGEFAAKLSKNRQLTTKITVFAPRVDYVFCSQHVYTYDMQVMRINKACNTHAAAGPFPGCHRAAIPPLHSVSAGACLPSTTRGKVFLLLSRGLCIIRMLQKIPPKSDRMALTEQRRIRERSRSIFAGELAVRGCVFTY